MRLAAEVLIFLLLSNVIFRPLVTITSFILNQEVITKELCENRDKPEVLCNGKCVLKKELAEQFHQTNPDEKSSSFSPIEELKYTIPSFEEEAFILSNKVYHSFCWKFHYVGISLSKASPPPNFV
jgi:hypothetical protein